MSRRDARAREIVLVSLGVALAVTPKFKLQYYARISSSRRAAAIAGRMEVVGIDAIAPQMAQRFAPFAVFSGEDANQWRIVEPTVREALITVPIPERVLLAKGDTDTRHKIAKQVFEAVDRKYRLVALPAMPANNPGGWWDIVFEQEYGLPKPDGTLPA
ncbi:hypothetical protein ShzoTeo12_11630 [Shinella zoogloeoides]|nr:hypothetical protein ShzoTeo12_11630 [Shinella zoogloeoides]